MFRSKGQRVLACIVFVVYLALLAWLILFKFSVDLRELDRIRKLNLLPFYHETDVSPLQRTEEILYNILIFIPLGVYICIFRPDRPLWKSALTVLCVSVLFEVIQYAFAIGISDVTDVIGNTAGGIAGILLYHLLRRLFRKKYISIANGIGLAAELVAVTMLAVLLIANG